MPIFGKETDEERTGLIGKLWETVSEFFAEGFRKVWKGFDDIFPEVFVKFFKKIGGGWADFTDMDFLRSLTFFEKQGLIDLDDMQVLYNFADQTPVLKPFFLIFFTLSLLMTTVKTKMAALGGTFMQKQNAKHSPYPPSPSDIIQGAFIAPEKTGEIRDRMKASGLSDDDIDLMFLAKYRLYNENVVRLLYLRGEITESLMFERMRELGFTDTRTKEIVKGWVVIPSIQDIIYMSGKEAFEEDIYKHIGMEKEFPSEQLKWAKMQGISEYFMMKYWIAHWQQPSIGQGFEMLHRQDPDRPGQSIIDDAEIDMLFRIEEIPPFWRERLKKIAYNPYARVDIRRMHKTGTVTDDDLIWSYRDAGYDIEHATKMAEFTILYNMGTEKNISRANIITAYKEKAIDETQATELLLDLNFTKQAIGFMLAYADYKEQKSFQDDLIDNIRDKYQNNLIEKRDAKAQLDGMNLPSAQVTLLMDKWTIKVYKNRKLPSKTDLSKWLIKGIINDDDFKWRMDQLGYPYDQVRHYLDYIKKTNKTI